MAMPRERKPDTRKGDRHRAGYWTEYGRIRRARTKGIDDMKAYEDQVTRLKQALGTYMFAVEQMNAAMKDGINVQGALSVLMGAEDMAKEALNSPSPPLSKAQKDISDE